MLKGIFILIITIIQFSAVAQSDSLNRYDNNGKKDGWWIVYMDKDLSRTYDTTEAMYAVYTWFDSDSDYFNIGRVGTRKHPVIAPAVKPNTNWPIPPLDGKYITKHNNENIRYEVFANEGRLISLKEYYKDGSLKEHVDFTQSCGDSPHHPCIYIYKKDGTLKKKTTIWTPMKDKE